MSELEFILPDTGIAMKLNCWGGSPVPFGTKDLEHFKSVFISVWETIPREDRVSVESHWSCYRRETGRPPRIELSDGQVNHNPQVLATTASIGMVIIFRWQICHCMPDDVLKALIAHEMAHVHQSAIGKSLHNMTVEDLRGIVLDQSQICGRLRDDALIEIHADETMTTWGFDYVVPSAYLWQHYDFKNDDYIRRKKPRDQVRSYKAAKRDRGLNRYDFRRVGGVTRLDS